MARSLQGSQGSSEPQQHPQDERSGDLGSGQPHHGSTSWQEGMKEKSPLPRAWQPPWPGGCGAVLPVAGSSAAWAPSARQPARSIHRPFQFAPLSSRSSLVGSYGRKELQMLSGPNNIHQSISRAEARIYTAARRAGNGLGFSKAASSSQSKPQDHGRTRALRSWLCLPQKELI